MYNRRGGTVDSGKDYEYKMLGLICLQCLLKKPEKMWLVTNVDNVGDFDDVIVYLKREGQPGVVYMFQMKHEDKQSDLTQGDFTHKDKPFNLEKHASGFSDLRELLKNSNKSFDDIENIDPDHVISVFYTNRGVSKNGLPFLKQYGNDNLDFLNSSSNNSCLYTFDFANLALNLENEDYCKNMYFFASQVNEIATDGCIAQQVEKLAKQLRLTKVDCKSIAKGFTEYIVKWAKKKLGGSWYITKEEIIYKFTELFLFKYAVKLNKEQCTFYECPKKLIWNNIVEDKLISVVAYDIEVFKFLKDYIGSEVRKYHNKFENKWNNNLSDNNRKMFLKNENLKTLLLSVVGKHNNLTMLDIYKCLWLNKKVPLLLEINTKENFKNIQTIFEWSNLNLKLIIIDKVNMNIADVASGNHFVNLKNLSRESRDKILNQSVKLQGRKGHILGDLVNESMHMFIKCNDIIHILLDDYNICNIYNPVKNYFIERKIYMTRIKFDCLEKINDDIFVIRDATKCKGGLINKLQNLNLLNKLNSTIIEENLADIEKLKASGKVIHRLVFHGKNWLELKESLGSTRNLRKYLVANQESVIDFEKLHKVPVRDKILKLFDNIYNKIRVVSGCPGMGKSTLLDFIADNAPTNMLVIKIILSHHDDYFKKLQSRSDISSMAMDPIRYFSQALFNHSDCLNIQLSKAVFKKLLEEKKILFLIDGFDEVTVWYKYEVTEIIKSLHEEEFHIWLTTRPHMDSHVENRFNTITMELVPFNEEDQRCFFNKYFKEICSIEENPLMTEFIDKLIKLAADNLNDHKYKFMEVPLRSKLLADVFSKDFKNSIAEGAVKIKEKVNVLYVYNEFIQGITDIYCSKFGKSAKDMSSVLNKHQQGLAVKILFHKEVVVETDMDDNLMYFYNILQREGLLIVHKTNKGIKIDFTHRTFAEFLAAQWLFENYDSTDVTVKKVVKTLLNTRFGNYRESYVFLFKIFDSMLAEDFRLHLAIINGQISEVEKLINSQSEEIYELDFGRRSVVHLAALYGISCLPNWPVIYYKEDLICAKDEMVALIEKIPLNHIENMVKKDSLGYNPMDYAIKTWSLAVADKLCEIGVNLNLGIHDYKENYENCPLHNHDNLLKTLSKQFICFESLENGLDENTNLRDYFSTYKGTVYKNINKYLKMLDANTLADLLEKIGVKLHNGCYRSLQFAIAFGSLDVITNFFTAKMNPKENHFWHAPFCSGIKRNRSDISVVIEILLRANFNINAPCSDGNTALHSACQVNNTELVEVLLKKGADVNQTNKNGETPLCLAYKNNSVDAARLLIKNNANIYALDSKGNSCIHLAAEKGQDSVIQQHLSNGYGINQPNKWGESPLHLAVQNGHITTSKLLLKHCVESFNADGNSCLHLAVVLGQTEIVRMLVDEGFDVNKPNRGNDTPLTLAFQKRHFDITEILLKNKTEGDTINISLYYAAKAGKDDIVLKLIEQGADINERDEDGKSALFIALEQKKFTIAKLLLQNDARIDIPDKLGNTCLHFAAEAGFDDIITQFIRAGINVNQQNEDGVTPLHIALKKGNISSARLLLANDARSDVVDHVGSTCLHFAAESGNEEITSDFIYKGFDIEQKNDYKQTPLLFALRKRHLNIAELLIAEGACVDDTEHLFYASLGGCLEEWIAILSVSKTTKIVIDYNLKNRYGDTLLYNVLRSYGIKDAVDVQLYLSNIKFLLNKGVDVNQTIYCGYTALHIISHYINIDDSKFIDEFYESAAEMLLDAGANINIRNNSKETALEVAHCNKHYNIVSLLQKRLESQNDY